MSWRLRPLRVGRRHRSHPTFILLFVIFIASRLMDHSGPFSMCWGLGWQESLCTMRCQCDEIVAVLLPFFFFRSWLSFRDIKMYSHTTVYTASYAHTHSQMQIQSVIHQSWLLYRVSIDLCISLCTSTNLSYVNALQITRHIFCVLFRNHQTENKCVCRGWAIFPLFSSISSSMNSEHVQLRVRVISFFSRNWWCVHWPNHVRCDHITAMQNAHSFFYFFVAIRLNSFFFGFNVSIYLNKNGSKVS